MRNFSCSEGGEIRRTRWPELSTLFSYRPLEYIDISPLKKATPLEV